jgi:tRNA dimethylallyltransferase
MLVETDKKSSEIIHPNNKKRVIRALEIFKITGKTKSDLDELANSQNSKYDFIKIGLNYSDRNLLYDKINKRADMMITNGLADEVQKLYDDGEEDNIRKTGAIGYVEILDYFNGLYNFDEAVEKIKQNTRNYAKRQLTWFKRDDKKTIWIDIDDINEDYIKNPCKIIKNCLKYVNL